MKTTYIVEVEWMKTDMMNYEYSYRHNVVFDSFDEAKNFAENEKKGAEADEEARAAAKAEAATRAYANALDSSAYDNYGDESYWTEYYEDPDLGEEEFITRIEIWSHTEDGEKDWKEWSAWER